MKSGRLSAGSQEHISMIASFIGPFKLLRVGTLPTNPATVGFGKWRWNGCDQRRHARCSRLTLHPGPRLAEVVALPGRCCTRSNRAYRGWRAICSLTTARLEGLLGGGTCPGLAFHPIINTHKGAPGRMITHLSARDLLHGASPPAKTGRNLHSPAHQECIRRRIRIAHGRRGQLVFQNAPLIVGLIS